MSYLYTDENDVTFHVFANPDEDDLQTIMRDNITYLKDKGEEPDAKAISEMKFIVDRKRKLLLVGTGYTMHDYLADAAEIDDFSAFQGKEENYSWGDGFYHNGKLCIDKAYSDIPFLRKLPIVRFVNSSYIAEDNIYQHMNIMTRNDYPFAGYNFDMNRDPFEWELNSTKALSRAFVIDTHVGFEVRFEVLNEAKLPAPWRQVLKPHNIRSVLKVSVGKFMADTNYMKLLPDTQPLNPSSETNLIKTIGKVMLSYQKVWGKNHYQIVVFNTGAGQRVNFLKALSKKLATIPAGMKPYDKLAAELMGVQKQFFVVFKNVYGSPIHEEYDAEFYPSDHELGMVVPKGGSSCSKCVFFKGEGKCGNKGFHEWRASKGAKDPSVIPAPPNQYCCDLYESGESLKEDDENINARPRIHRGAWKWRTPDGEYPRPTKYPDPDPDFGPGRPFSNRQVLVDPETGQHWMCLVNYYHDGGVVSIYPEKLVKDATPDDDLNDNGFLYDESTKLKEYTQIASISKDVKGTPLTFFIMENPTKEDLQKLYKNNLDYSEAWNGKIEASTAFRYIIDLPEKTIWVFSDALRHDEACAEVGLDYDIDNEELLFGDASVYSLYDGKLHLYEDRSTYGFLEALGSISFSAPMGESTNEEVTSAAFAAAPENAAAWTRGQTGDEINADARHHLDQMMHGMGSQLTHASKPEKMKELFNKHWAEIELEEHLIRESQIKVLQNYTLDHIDIIDVIARDSKGKLFGDTVRYKDKEYQVHKHPKIGAFIAIS